LQLGPWWTYGNCMQLWSSAMSAPWCTNRVAKKMCPSLFLIRQGQLNQTFGSRSGQKRLKPQTFTMPPLPLRCAAACPGMQCAYDDLGALTKKLTGGDLFELAQTLHKYVEYI
jgi:hypothetical protein